MLRKENNRLIFHYDAEEMWIEPWGADAVRVRATKNCEMPDENWALLKPEDSACSITVSEDGADLVNGKLKVHVTGRGKITMYNQDGKLLLEEYWRNRRDVTDPKCSAIEVEAREFRPNIGGNYHLTARFESLDRNEKIYGMGQYQQPYLNLKGADLEMAHRNSQASVPFAVSSLGYGILWNNPGIGRAVFGSNIMSFENYAAKAMDYWFVAGDTPAEIVSAYGKAAGAVPMMPEYGLGFWQCKLRYQTQEELLEVAREYKRRNLPIDVIVVDYFHWPKQGEWKFDPVYWPDPEAMIRELKEMGIELMVSIWPTVDRDSENYEEMLEKGYLIRTERGFRTGLDFMGATIHYDATNPEARKYLWNKAKKNYYDKGIKVFWLDEAEPEYTAYDFDNYRYYRGTDLEIGNIYPVEYAKTFYEGMEEEGQENIVNAYKEQMLDTNQKWIENNARLYGEIVKTEEDREKLVKNFKMKLNHLAQLASKAADAAETAKKNYSRELANLQTQISILKSRLEAEKLAREEENTAKNKDKTNPFASASEENAEEKKNQKLSDEYAIMEISGKGNELAAKLINKSGSSFMVQKGTVLQSGHTVDEISQTYLRADKNGTKDYLYFAAGGVLDREPVRSSAARAGITPLPQRGGNGDNDLEPLPSLNSSQGLPSLREGMFIR